ncbi:calcium ATPase [Peniophora sp. CONT]|nr:calcium ATPase [Peniophora sp. CONT]
MTLRSRIPLGIESPVIPQIAAFGSSTEHIDANGEPYQPPPSPTSSQSSTGSVHWASSAALRENAPGNGLSSLHLLAAPTSHHRRSSSATAASTDSETVAGDHAQDVPLSPKSGQFTLDTATQIDDDTLSSRSPSGSTDEGKNEGKHRFSRPNTPSPSASPSLHPLSDGPRSSSESASGRSGDRQEEGMEMDSKLLAQAALEDEGDHDPAPFRFKPRVLANLVDPKSLEALDGLGGVDGLLSGLGTRADSGLSSSPARSSEHRTSSEHTAAASDMAKRSSIATNDGKPDENDVSSLRAGTRNPHYNQHASDSADAFEADMDERARVYGHNVLPARASKSLLTLMWDALTDRVLILLSVAAVVSLALGFFQVFGPARDPDQPPPVDWVEGVAIIVAIMVVVLVGSWNDWQKERQFQVLNAKEEDRAVKVVRDSEERLIGVHDVVVGDIALLEPGEVVPCDGVFLSGHNVKCDESGVTGESNAIRKVSYADCQELLNKNRSEKGKHAEGKRALELMGHTDCFVVSGSRVLEGVGRYVVIAVGTKSFNGRSVMALRGDAEYTPLQGKLDRLAIAWAGMIASLVLFVGLMIRLSVELGTGILAMTPAQSGFVFVHILIISVTLVVVAVSEGLPLVPRIQLMFATKCMTSGRLPMCILGSCETIFNATVVCAGKFDTLTRYRRGGVASLFRRAANFGNFDYNWLPNLSSQRVARIAGTLRDNLTH